MPGFASGSARRPDHRLAHRSESELRRLLEQPDGRPSQPQLNELRGALVRLIGGDARLGLAAQRVLDSMLIERLRGTPAAEQRRWLVDLAGSPDTRRRLADAALSPHPARTQPIPPSTTPPLAQTAAPRPLPVEGVERLDDGIASTWNAIVRRPKIDPIRDTEARRLLEALQLRGGDRVANIGIGAGDFETRTGAPSRVGPGDWLGIDVSSGMLREAALRHPGIGLLKADFRNLPDGLRFDKCVAHHVLCHVPDLDAGLQAIFDRLPEGGVFTFVERVTSQHDLTGLVMNLRYPSIPETDLRQSLSQLEFARGSLEFLHAIERGGWRVMHALPITLDSLQMTLIK
jgi:SAM-dependent methyltransferase